MHGRLRPTSPDATLRGFHFNFGRVIPTAREAMAGIEDERVSKAGRLADAACAGRYPGARAR
jgi:hypothetical protein